MRRLFPTTQSSCAGSGGPRRRVEATTTATCFRGRLRRGAGEVASAPPEPRQGGLCCPRREASPSGVAARGSSGGVGDVVESVVAVEDARRRQRPPPLQAPQGEDARREPGWALMRWLLETGVFG